MSELVQVHTIHQGQGVGYGSTYIADKDQIIGTVPVGYADGFIRKFQGFKIKVGNEFCPIVGRVCMDQLMVLLPYEMAVGTKVVLISNNPAAPSSIKRLLIMLTVFIMKWLAYLMTACPANIIIKKHCTSCNVFMSLISYFLVIFVLVNVNARIFITH